LRQNQKIEIETMTGRVSEDINGLEKERERRIEISPCLDNIARRIIILTLTW
jgi:hypothetical protein